MLHFDKGLLTTTTIYVLSALIFSHLAEAGAKTNILNTILHPCVSGIPPFLAFLMDVKSPNFHLIFYFHITFISLTLLFMIGSDIFVRLYRRSKPTPVNAPSSTLVNPIPFLTLNISIVLTIVVNIVAKMFGLTLFNNNTGNTVILGELASLILATLLLTNKGALKHLRLRLRQNFDSATIGRSSSLPLFVRKTIESLRNNRVEPVVSIALVTVRDFRGIQ